MEVYEKMEYTAAATARMILILLSSRLNWGLPLTLDKLGKDGLRVKIKLF
jgi:hypothetical protein